LSTAHKPLTSCMVEGTYLPKYSHPGDAGADLQAATREVIPPRSKKLIGTGIRVKLPENHVGLIWPRSGLAVKHAIDSGAGVVDSGYRGEIKVLLFNHSDEEFHIQPGDRIAQILIQKVTQVEFLQVENLEESVRGDNGFGSTG